MANSNAVISLIVYCYLLKSGNKEQLNLIILLYLMPMSCQIILVNYINNFLWGSIKRIKIHLCIFLNCELVVPTFISHFWNDLNVYRLRYFNQWIFISTCALKPSTQFEVRWKHLTSLDEDNIVCSPSKIFFTTPSQPMCFVLWDWWNWSQN